jgi:hypothetical protein
MRRLASFGPRKRIWISLSIAVGVFLIVYLVWAFQRASTIFSDAVMRSEARAHTIVGKEGYEYIFDPTTHVFIDRIKPHGTAIITYLVRKHYLPSLEGPECTFPDREACRWINANIHLGRNHRIDRRNMALYASTLGLVCAGGYYLLTKQGMGVEPIKP